MFEDKKIAIIGLGKMGSATFAEINNKISSQGRYELIGVDINGEVLRELSRKYPESEFTKTIPNDADIYIFSIYPSDSIKDLYIKINDSNNPLVIIESAISQQLSNWLLRKKENQDLVLFPHRYKPDCKQHSVFDLDRIMGGADKKSILRAKAFYKIFMDPKKIHIINYSIIPLSEHIENAYRFLEIAIAEDWKMECDRIGIDFKELRKAINTREDINLKEARGGISGKFLPKDIKIIEKLFNKSRLIPIAIKADREYKEYKSKELSN